MRSDRHELRLRTEGGLIGLIPTACLVTGYFIMPDKISIPVTFLVFSILFLIATLVLYLHSRINAPN